MASFDDSRVWSHMFKRVIRPKKDFEESEGNWPIFRVPLAAIVSTVQDG